MSGIAAVFIEAEGSLVDGSTRQIENRPGEQ